MTKDVGSAAPSFVDVLRVPKYLPVFLASALSLWGDNIARITIAAIVFQRTSSPLAAATTLAVSYLPAVFGRSLVGPVVDRLPYKWVIVWGHLLRALCVGALLVLVLTEAKLLTIFAVLVVLETIGGAASASSMILMTDLFPDRQYYARAIGLNALSEQTNQAFGLAVGGALVAWLGPGVGLLADLVSFLVAAITILIVVELRPVSGERGKGLPGFVRDLHRAAGDMVHHPVLARFILLSVVACVGIAAPEALAVPIAGESWWAGPLMAAPVAGAVLGIILITRRDVRWQNSSLIPLAMLMPLPLVLTMLHLPFPLLAALWFLSGMLQAFMVPLQATFTLVTPEALRGRIFSLAGALSVAAAAGSYLGAGWLAQHTGPEAAVTVCAGVCLVLVALLGLRWPEVAVRQAVEAAYAPSAPASTARAA
ncbi:MFS transporter [Intrasporangium sp.]|uniref:MFS transporter n=1 Tax=Intrasporangium sp. TaxID=1925024 RepID=UPI003221B4B8